MLVKNKYLFNFAASYGGGGLKRLYEYAKWFNINGGAWFIIHPKCENLIKEFPSNLFFIADIKRYQRIFDDCKYLDRIGVQIGMPDLYYSYGIPVYIRFGRINWFHLSNVLPLDFQHISPLPLFDRIKFLFLGWRIMQNFKNADVISAESNYSLGLIDVEQTDKLFLSVNGSDDELTLLQIKQASHKKNIATVVGTYISKALNDSYQVFEMLRKENHDLKLVIIGNKKTIPKILRSKENIILSGILPRKDVIECLREAKYYISTTKIENSYNAASEGIFFADESFISDIGPHRELLSNMPFKEISIPKINRSILHVKRSNITTANLKSWDDVISEMINKVHNLI